MRHRNAQYQIKTVALISHFKSGVCPIDVLIDRTITGCVETVRGGEKLVQKKNFEFYSTIAGDPVRSYQTWGLS